MQVRKNEGTPQQRKGNVIMKEEKSHHQSHFYCPMDTLGQLPMRL